MHPDFSTLKHDVENFPCNYQPLPGALRWARQIKTQSQEEQAFWRFPSSYTGGGGETQKPFGIVKFLSNLFPFSSSDSSISSFQGLFLPETKYDIQDNINLLDLIALSMSLQCSEDSVGGRLTLSSSTQHLPFLFHKMLITSTSGKIEPST